MNKENNNLFICSNALTVIIAALIIEEKHKNDNNILLITINNIDINFWNSTAAIANKLKCFSKIVLFDAYCKKYPYSKNDLRLNPNIFNFELFEKDTNVKDFQNIYSTLFYTQAKIVSDKYPTAHFHVFENGTASYLPQYLEERYMNRIEEFYSFNYFDLIYPYEIFRYKNIKNITIDKTKIINKFDELATELNIKEDKNAVIFCAQNLSPGGQEFGEYYQTIKKLLNDGYNVYFKDHPKMPTFFKDKVTQIKSENFKIIYDAMPIEIIATKLKPKAVVGVFSTSLLTLPHLFNIPAYTMLLKNNLLKNPSFAHAYGMILSYLPLVSDLGVKEFSIISNLHIENMPLTNLIHIKIMNNVFKEMQFEATQKAIQNYDYNMFKFFEISEELYNKLKTSTYEDFLDYINLRRTGLRK